MNKQTYAVILAGVLAIANTLGLAMLMTRNTQDHVTATQRIVDMGSIEVIGKRETQLTVASPTRKSI